MGTLSTRKVKARGLSVRVIDPMTAETICTFEECQWAENAVAKDNALPTIFESICAPVRPVNILAINAVRSLGTVGTFLVEFDVDRVTMESETTIETFRVPAQTFVFRSARGFDVKASVLPRASVI